MSAKEQKHSENKVSSKQHPPQNTANLETTAKQSSPPAALFASGEFQPGSLTAGNVLQLQRVAGNRAVGQVLSGARTRPVIQTKLTVGAAHDPYEQEADQIAEQVMRMPTAPVATMQRASEDEDELQAKPLASTLTPLVQRATTAGSFETNQEFESRLNATRGGGNPLPASVREFMEPRFGADFSGVRVHADGEAAQLNRAVSAQAFTLGQDVYLGEGKSDLESNAGKQLLAHELTHVVQQGATGAALQTNMLSRTVIQRTLWKWDGTSWKTLRFSNSDQDMFPKPDEQQFEDLKDGQVYDQETGNLFANIEAYDLSRKLKAESSKYPASPFMPKNHPRQQGSSTQPGTSSSEKLESQRRVKSSEGGEKKQSAVPDPYMVMIAGPNLPVNLSNTSCSVLLRLLSANGIKQIAYGLPTGKGGTLKQVDESEVDLQEKQILLEALYSAIISVGQLHVNNSNFRFKILRRLKESERPAQIQLTVEPNGMATIAILKREPPTVPQTFQTVSQAQQTLVAQYGLKEFTEEGGSHWVVEELNMVAAALARVPEADRDNLKNLVVCREKGGEKDNEGGSYCEALHKLALRNKAFTENHVSFTGSGDHTAPVVFTTILHEVGHVVEKGQRRAAYLKDMEKYSAMLKLHEEKIGRLTKHLAKCQEIEKQLKAMTAAQDSKVKSIEIEWSSAAEQADQTGTKAQQLECTFLKARDACVDPLNAACFPTDVEIDRNLSKKLKPYCAQIDKVFELLVPVYEAGFPECQVSSILAGAKEMEIKEQDFLQHNKAAPFAQAQLFISAADKVKQAVALLPDICKSVKERDMAKVKCESLFKRWENASGLMERLSSAHQDTTLLGYKVDTAIGRMPPNKPHLDVTATTERLEKFNQFVGQKGISPLTPYAISSVESGENEEFFAEAYTLYLNEPTYLAKHAPDLYKYFERGDYR